ncbi:MAG: SDR family NAD(P)-dependent oxidoreductase, partial [Microthrixaceae bacterium]
SGIGLGIAQRLCADGFAVALLDRDGAAATAESERLAAAGSTATGIEVDVADGAAVKAAFDAARRDLGPVTVVVTSAGIEAFDPIGDIDEDLWNRVIAVNLTGTFTCIQACVPDMVAAGWGRIVTIASSSAQSGAPDMAHYTASKGGVISMTRSLAKELARSGITANSISPTIVDTPMARKGAEDGKVPPVDVLAKYVPLGRPGTPEDIAGMCSYLCSDDGSYVTGQVMGVNGGMYI